MHAVFDGTPMSARDFEEPPGIGFLARQGRHTINGLGLFDALNGPFTDELADLPNSGPGQVAVEGHAAGQCPAFQTTVAFPARAGGLTFSLPFALGVGGKRPLPGRRIPD